jgi:hypothetical protein
MMGCFEIMPQASRVFTFSQSEAMKCAPRYVGRVLGQKSSKTVEYVKRKKCHASRNSKEQVNNRFKENLQQIQN